MPAKKAPDIYIPETFSDFHGIPEIGRRETPLTYKVDESSGRPVLAPVRLKATSEFSRRNRPWKVTLVIYPEKNARNVSHTDYYVRCGNPQDAVTMAAQFFKKWEKDFFAPKRSYPDFEGVAMSVCIDERDWDGFLKDARKETTKVFMHFGDVRNPVVFTFYPDGWPKVWQPFFRAAAARAAELKAKRR
jgi:hypothetical protein